MTLTLVITERAHQDIERNAVWWARNHSLTQAIDWQEAVYRQIETIPEMPESYPPAPENSTFDEELRQKNVVEIDPADREFAIAFNPLQVPTGGMGR
ncbi:MAG: hypothetical protein R3C17_20785 [Planctomycetaceae bacterium]